MKLTIECQLVRGGFSRLLLICSLFLMFSCGGIVPGSEPKVVSSSPSAQNNRDFPLNRGLSVTFNKEIEVASLNKSTFFIHEAGVSTALSGSIATDGVTASLKPDTNLKFSSVYVLTVTRGVKDLSGNALSEDFQLSFTTLSGSPPSPPGTEPNPNTGLDTDPPRIIAISPSNGASGVRLNSLIAVTFSEAIAPESLTSETFDLNRGTTARRLFLSGQMAIFEPDEDLRSDEHYRVTLTTGIKDLAGNSLVSDFMWTFSTEDDDGDAFNE